MERSNRVRNESRMQYQISEFQEDQVEEIRLETYETCCSAKL